MELLLILLPLPFFSLLITCFICDRKQSEIFNKLKLIAETSKWENKDENTLTTEINGVRIEYLYPGYCSRFYPHGYFFTKNKNISQFMSSREQKKLNKIMKIKIDKIIHEKNEQEKNEVSDILTNKNKAIVDNLPLYLEDKNKQKISKLIVSYRLTFANYSGQCSEETWDLSNPPEHLIFWNRIKGLVQSFRSGTHISVPSSDLTWQLSLQVIKAE